MFKRLFSGVFMKNYSEQRRLLFVYTLLLSLCVEKITKKINKQALAELQKYIREVSELKNVRGGGQIFRGFSNVNKEIRTRNVTLLGKSTLQTSNKNKI